MHKTIGVLALQGSFEEHLHKLVELSKKIETMSDAGTQNTSFSGITSLSYLPVKTIADIETIDALILPGGESTTIGKLLRIFDLLEPIKKRIERGLPVWGTCCGMILLAKEVYLYESKDGLEEPHIVQSPSHLACMDISVMRNSWGSQLHSFTADVSVPCVSPTPLPLVFIRGPSVRSILPVPSGQESARSLAEVNGQIVAVRQGTMLATSFHPELIAGTAFYEYFLTMTR